MENEELQPPGGSVQRQDVNDSCHSCEIFGENYDVVIGMKTFVMRCRVIRNTIRPVAELPVEEGQSNGSGVAGTSRSALFSKLIPASM